MGHFHPSVAGAVGVRPLAKVATRILLGGGRGSDPGL